MFRKPVNTVSVTLDDGGYNRYLLIVHSANSESIFPDVTDECRDNDFVFRSLSQLDDVRELVKSPKKARKTK